VMSLKRMPSTGKFGTSRILDARSITLLLRVAGQQIIARILKGQRVALS
jgi:hypothetical protein